MKVRVAGLVAATALGGGVASAQPTQLVPARAEHNYRAAQRDVRRRLSKVPLPGGATPTQGNPASSAQSLKGPAFVTLSSASVGTHKFWRVAGEQPAAVLSWFKKHVPAGAGIYGSGTDSGPGFKQSDLGLSYRAIADVLPNRELSISVTAARGGGAAVRIDADDVYWIPRPKWERIPAGVQTAEVTVQRTDPSSTSQLTVTKRATIKKLVSLVNDQPQTQPYVISCPVLTGPEVTVKFFGASGAAPVATVVANASGCGGALVTLHGKPAPDLSTGSTLADDFSRILGFKD